MDDLTHMLISALRDGDIAEYISSIQLLWMPDSESLSSLGTAAGWFRDDGGDPDGDLLLAPADAFSEDELAAALAAGGKLVDGCQFPYPRGVAVGEVASGWCAYKDVEIGYALDRNVATAVCAASVGRLAEEG
jgi:hypothetical protein